MTSWLRFSSSAVGKAKDTKPLCRQPGVAGSVRVRVVMLWPVGLDDQPMPETDEVDDVAADDLLPLELQAFEMTAPQQGPHAPLVQDRRAAHRPGPRLQPFVCRLHENKHGTSFGKCRDHDPSPPAGEGGRAQRGRMRGHRDVEAASAARSPTGPARATPHPSAFGCHLLPQGEKGDGRRPGRLQDVPGKDRRLREGRHQPLRPGTPGGDETRGPRGDAGVFRPFIAKLKAALPSNQQA
ncbi:hypothetical protein MMB232_00224 [Brevundimonas subvibrioides]